MSNTIKNLIEEVANKKLNGKYNLKQYCEGGKKHDEKVKAQTHKEVCEAVVKFMAENQQIPMYFVLSVGVGDGAYRMGDFDKGYKKFDADKVLMVYKMGMAYLAYNKVCGKMSDVVIRLIKRFHDKVSSDFETFEDALRKSKVLGKDATTRLTDYKLLCENLGIPF